MQVPHQPFRTTPPPSGVAAQGQQAATAAGPVVFTKPPHLVFGKATIQGLGLGASVVLRDWQERALPRPLLLIAASDCACPDRLGDHNVDQITFTHDLSGTGSRGRLVLGTNGRTGSGGLIPMTWLVQEWQPQTGSARTSAPWM